MGQENETDTVNEVDTPADAPVSDSNEGETVAENATESEPEVSEIDVLQCQLDEKDVALKNESDHRLRAYAELENFRKRKEQEFTNFKKFAKESFILELLPVLDSMELALKHAETAESVEALLEGFKLISKQFDDVFSKMDVTKIKAIGQPFDPNLHQAVGKEDGGDGVEADTVLKEMQVGYTLNGRVIRPSMVIIAN